MLPTVPLSARGRVRSAAALSSFWARSSPFPPSPQLTSERRSDIHVIGIRSKTKLSERVLREAKNLLVIGCFCIGTNQVDLEYAASHGIAVFNSPFANSRSVAELVIGEIISLARQLGDRSNEMHRGTWNKVSAKCWEIRGKTLGESDLDASLPSHELSR